MKTSQQTDKLFPALLKVKSELGSVTKSASNPFYKSKYADLNTHLEVVEPVLERHGMMLLQPGVAGGYGADSSTIVESVIIHAESGQWVSSEMSLILPKVTMQDAGSAITYARRYTLGALLALRAEDDDAESAMGRTKKPNYEPKQGSIPGLSGPTPPVAQSAPSAIKSTFRKPTNNVATTSDEWEN